MEPSYEDMFASVIGWKGGKGYGKPNDVIMGLESSKHVCKFYE